MNKQEWKNGEPVQVQSLTSDNFGYDWDNGYRYGGLDKATGRHFIVCRTGTVSMLNTGEFRRSETELQKQSRMVKELQIAITGCDIPFVATRLYDLGVTAEQLKSNKEDSE